MTSSSISFQRTYVNDRNYVIALLFLAVFGIIGTVGPIVGSRRIFERANPKTYGRFWEPVAIHGQSYLLRTIQYIFMQTKDYFATN